MMGAFCADTIIIITHVTLVATIDPEVVVVVVAGGAVVVVDCTAICTIISNHEVVGDLNGVQVQGWLAVCILRVAHVLQGNKRAAGEGKKKEKWKREK